MTPPSKLLLRFALSSVKNRSDKAYISQILLDLTGGGSFPLHVEVTPLSFDQMTANRPSETSEAIRARVIRARDSQTARFVDQSGIIPTP